MRIDWEVPITMDDGLVLRADVYRPIEAGHHPVILSYGVYAKGTKHRLRVVLKALEGARTAVTVERRVWKEERILWMDKEGEVTTTDRKVETEVLDALAAAL